MYPGNKPSFSHPKRHSFSQNESEKKLVFVQENAETVLPHPLHCFLGTQIPPFLSKTFDLVDDPCLDPIVSWGSEGVSFVVWDLLEFSRIVLPKYFKHNNFSSFVRQLNTYGFRKIDTDKWEFANEGFLRGNRNLLKNIQRRRSPQSQPIGVSIELDKEELQSELEELKKQKSLIMTEVGELQKQQHGTTLQMEALNENLYVAEQRQKKMVSILTKLLQNREFLARLGQNNVQKAMTTHRKMKKFLKHQYEPDLENITRTPEFNPSPVEEILEFLVENKKEYTSFVPCHAESILDKGKNVASSQVEADSEYFVSYPEEMEREKKFTEVSSVEMGSVVKQEDLWNLDFEDEAGMPGSSRDFLGNFNNYDDMAELGFNSSLSDVWDLGSWPADDYLCPQNFDGSKIDP